MPFKKGFLSRAPFPVAFHQDVAAGTMLTTHALFTNPNALGEDYEVLGIDGVWDVVSASGTIDVRNVPSGTAMTGGTTLLTATQSTAGSARVPVKFSLTTNRNTRVIKRGNTVSMILAGTQTGLVGLALVLWLQAIRGVRSR